MAVLVVFIGVATVFKDTIQLKLFRRFSSKDLYNIQARI